MHYGSTRCDCGTGRGSGGVIPFESCDFFSSDEETAAVHTIIWDLDGEGGIKAVTGEVVQSADSVLLVRKRRPPFFPIPITRSLLLLFCFVFCLFHHSGFHCTAYSMACISGERLKFSSS